MDRDTVARVEIDGDGRLHVVPSERSFPLIYREAMEVHWDPGRGSLYSPKPRDWGYPRWLQQILSAALAQDCQLQFSAGTAWLNIDPGTKAELLQVVGNGA